MPATHPYIPRVSVVFDFDRTLATDTIDALCAAWGIEREEWERDYRDPLGEHWDDIIQRAWALIECGRKRGDPLSYELFDRAAQQIELYPGVTELKRRLSEKAARIHEEIEVELVVLSSGFNEIIERTEVKQHFDKIWAGAFHFDENDEAVTIKRIISHPEKTLYLEALAKGLPIDTASAPDVDRPDIEPEDMHVPFDQMIYVGDGVSDLDSFGFVGGHGGLALAVNKSASFDHAGEQTKSERVENLAPPDFSTDAEMFRSLAYAVESAAARAAIRRMGREE